MKEDQKKGRVLKKGSEVLNLAKINTFYYMYAQRNHYFVQ